MSDHTPSEYEPEADKFAEQAQQASTGLLREFFDFLRHNKKWWLLPLILALLLFGLLVIIAGSVAAPFIYPFF